jgi:hypothetical protein
MLCCDSSSTDSPSDSGSILWGGRAQRAAIAIRVDPSKNVTAKLIEYGEPCRLRLARLASSTDQVIILSATKPRSPAVTIIMRVTNVQDPRES